MMNGIPNMKRLILWKTFSNGEREYANEANGKAAIVTGVAQGLG